MTNPAQAGGGTVSAWAVVLTASVTLGQPQTLNLDFLSSCANRSSRSLPLLISLEFWRKLQMQRSGEREVLVKGGVT